MVRRRQIAPASRTSQPSTRREENRGCVYDERIKKQLSLTAAAKEGQRAQDARAKPAAASDGTRHKPKLGQNFLVDHGVARRIVEALGDVSNRTVIEIGPAKAF